MQNSTICIKKRKTRYNTQWVPKVKACLIEALPLMSVRPKSNISISNVVAFTAITVSQLKLRCCSEALQLADKTMPDRWKDRKTEKEWESERVRESAARSWKPTAAMLELWVHFELTLLPSCTARICMPLTHTHTHTACMSNGISHFCLRIFYFLCARSLSLSHAPPALCLCLCLI